MQSRSRRPRVVPDCPPGPLLGGVDDELSEDGVDNVSLQRPYRLPLGLALGYLLLEVDPSIGNDLLGLTDGQNVDHMVESMVASMTQPVDTRYAPADPVVVPTPRPNPKTCNSYPTISHITRYTK